MLLPHTVTVFNVITKTADDYSTTEQVYAAVLDGVFIMEKHSGKPARAGSDNQSSLEVFIPFFANALDANTGESLEYALPDYFEKNPAGHWTLMVSGEKADGRCFIIKGNVPAADYKAIKAMCGAKRVTAVETFDFGSCDLQHWEVYGK